MFPDVPGDGQPLSGLVVIECAIFQQAPYATAMLADFGATVIHVEGPDSPDPGRGLSVVPGHPNAYFESHNRNKRGIVLDLKHPEGRETLLKLVERADIFVQNMRQGVMEKLGLAYADLRARNPRIIYASASGYGSRGPQRQWPAMDLLGQARGGTTLTQGPPDIAPVWSFPGMADQVGATFLAYGIMVALWHRHRTGDGQEVDASLLGGQVALQSFNITGTLFTGKVPPRRDRLQAEPLWNMYECRDGRFLAMAMAQGDRWWSLLCEALGRHDLREDPRFAVHKDRMNNRGDLIAIFDAIFITRDQVDWTRELAGDWGLPVSAVQDYSQIAEDPQVHANNYVVDFPHPEWPGRKMVGPAVQLGATPGSIRTPAPEFGQHTEEVLLEFGLDWDEISRLKDIGAAGAR